MTNSASEELVVFFLFLLSLLSSSADDGCLRGLLAAILLLLVAANIEAIDDKCDGASDEEIPAIGECAPSRRPSSFLLVDLLPTADVVRGGTDGLPLNKPPRC